MFNCGDWAGDGRVVVQAYVNSGKEGLWSKRMTPQGWKGCGPSVCQLRDGGVVAQGYVTSGMEG